MCITAVDNYPATILFFADQYKTQENCIKAVNNCSFVFDSVPDQYKTQQMCNKPVDDYADALEFVSDQYKLSAAVSCMAARLTGSYCFICREN